jgi:hypothetical protein
MAWRKLRIRPVNRKGRVAEFVAGVAGAMCFKV